MPCSDVTEWLELTLDQDDGVTDFVLQKDTCGAPVGNALLLEYIQGIDPQRLLDVSLLELVPTVHDARHLDQFLLSKQLYALQEALAVYTGVKSGGKGELFTVEKLEYGPANTVIKGLVRVDLITEKIRACGNCGCA